MVELRLHMLPHRVRDGQDLGSGELHKPRIRLPGAYVLCVLQRLEGGSGDEALALAVGPNGHAIEGDSASLGSPASMGDTRPRHVLLLGERELGDASAHVVKL